MDSFQRYGQQYGIPLALYADKHSTYHSPAPPSVEEPRAGVRPMSHFGRALGELRVELILSSHSRNPNPEIEIPPCSLGRLSTWVVTRSSLSSRERSAVTL